MKKRTWWGVMLVGAAFLTMTFVSSRRTEGHVSGGDPQDVANLDRRITSVEQRMFSIESSLNMLQRQATMLPGASATSREQELQLTLLERQVESQRLVIRELECALAKLDERTLPASVRESRRKAGMQSADPCRLNPDAPLQLPAAQ